MLEKVKKTIEEFSLLVRGERVVVAVSGGPDSVALLKVLTMIAGQYNLSLLVAHLNHGLREDEADREENFVRLLAQAMDVEYVAEKIDISRSFPGGKSLEEICREKRYAFLEQAARAYGATKIALGHHLQDQAETVLMNLLRGSGCEGLRGMLPLRDGAIIRPLLRITREEILIFLKREKLSFMNDSSNSQDLFARNRIRHHLIPILKASFNPQVEENLARTAEIMRRDNDYLREKVDKTLRKWGICRDGGEKKISIPDLLELHEAIQHRVIKTLLLWTSTEGRGIGYRHVRSALALAQGSGGTRCLNLPGGITLCREYNSLAFLRSAELQYLSRLSLDSVADSRKSCYRYDVEIPSRMVVKEAKMTLKFEIVDRGNFQFPHRQDRVALMDFETIRLPLVIRSVKPGDRIQPLGMKGTKKLKSFFIDEKVPRRQRDIIPVLADQESIVWVVGMRACERTCITEETRQVLMIEIV